ncbi:TRAP-type mannitol/chloroaromatic compound transport system, periplasmic component [Desulfocurvibacter africanus PCS]|uniref:TRAP-type mannitol/chloroaromatic compound transport system, periplasmic component n=1 Tax=Desulfocurvibacter africanus PCS TaxID=1262666 RepID=M5PQN0_DESAF|nr:TRAP transporter substrate-binding protein [Desulfocurvibacter africanus]EMG36394.1 TRAP-type mannitol/chloroaromatic compound transport system, periplasmic component [Desulfocurvibacter africanus PCS]
MKRRDFLKKASIGATTAAAATIINAPFVHASKKTTIKWRLQTYAGPALAEHVIKPQIDAFNKAANGEMVIELYNSDQLVPTGELFRAMQRGTIDAVQSDDDSIAAPVDVSVFAAYFPFASRYSLDVPTLFNHYGLKQIWEEAYSEVKGVTWLGAGAWDPCNFCTRTPIRSVKDLKGKRIFTFPTGGRFLRRFGVVPVTLPWEDVEVALQTGELDGIAWSGITEAYTVGWANVTKYYLTNNISGAWAGSYFANSDKWNALPEHLKTLFNLSMDSSNYYRQHWYWWGEAHYRTTGGKLELTSIPDSEWQTVEDEAVKFWDEIASKSPRNAKVVQILKNYTATMRKAGKPYRYS